MVYSGLYPVNNNDFEDLREALGKLKLNDSSFTYSPEVSDGLGFGSKPRKVGRRRELAAENHLHRDHAVEASLPGPIDDAHSAAAQLGEQFIIADRSRERCARQGVGHGRRPLRAGLPL